MLTTEPEAPDDPPPDPPASDGSAPRQPTHRIARVVGSIGRLMMTTGVVILLLVAYQLWGTNLQTNRAQAELADEFAGIVEEADTATSSTTTTASTTTTTAEDGPPETMPVQVAPDIEPPAHGEPIGNLEGLQLLQPGVYLVTDWAAGVLYRVDAKGKADRLIKLSKGSADLIYLPDKQTVLIPIMLNNSLVAYALD